MDAMCKSKPASTEEAGAETGEDNVLHTELKIAQDELDTMAKLNSRLGYEIKRNELALSNMMKNYDGRQQFARRLEADVNKVELSNVGNTASTNTNCNKAALNKIEVSDELLEKMNVFVGAKLNVWSTSTTEMH